MAMTVPQKKYFIKRIDEICSMKIAKVPTLSMDKGVAIKRMIKDNTLRLQTRNQIHKTIMKELRKQNTNYYGFGMSLNLDQLYVNYEQTVKLWEDTRDDAEQERDTFIKSIEDKATHIKDVAMFGSEEIAHDMLQKFMDFTP